MPYILIAEDDPLISKSLSEALEGAGHASVVVTDGEAALQSIQEKTPDLLLLDISMPKLDGVGVAWEIRKNPKTASLPIIMLTNNADSGNVSKLIEVGVTDYLLKSEQSMDDILRKVDEVLHRTVHF
jgi:chemosensory pili system protein ChpA (sensor histidine kinase/response regulator)